MLLAVLCAAQSLKLDVGLIVSMGASQWEANVLDFTWLEMEAILLTQGLLPASYASDAASLGGVRPRNPPISTHRWYTRRGQATETQCPDLSSGKVVA